MSKIMHRLQFRFTRNFNLKYKTWGHLFQGRYKAILCDRDTYFLELSAYIHLNPVRAGLVKNPDDYPWSSYLCYLGREKKPIADIDQVLSHFSASKGAARRKYDLYVKDRLAQGHRDDLYETKDQRFLGGDEYLENVQRHVNETLPFSYEIELGEIVTRVGAAFEIPMELIYSSTRNRRGAWGRALCAYLGTKLGGFKLREIAEHFNRDPVAIAYGLKKVEQRLSEDKKIGSEVMVLQNSLVSNRRRRINT